MLTLEGCVVMLLLVAFCDNGRALGHLWREERRCSHLRDWAHWQERGVAVLTVSTTKSDTRLLHLSNNLFLLFSHFLAMLGVERLLEASHV